MMRDDQSAVLHAKIDLLRGYVRKAKKMARIAEGSPYLRRLYDNWQLKNFEGLPMLQVALLYTATAAVFLALDAIGIRFLIRPVFERNVGHLLADPLRLGPAALFYLGYVAGLVWLVSWPALKANDPVHALIGGLIIGLMCYGTYEMTNYATLADWSWEQVIIDGLWGMLLTGFSAWIGVLALSGRFN